MIAKCTSTIKNAFTFFFFFSVTDVIPKEQLWKSFLESSNGIAGTMSREMFFSELGEAFDNTAFVDVKTVRKDGKKIGFRCLRVRTQHFDSPNIRKERNVVCLEGVGKSDEWTQVARNAIDDPSDHHQYRQTKRLEPADVSGVYSSFKETVAEESVEGSCGSGHRSEGGKRRSEGQRGRLQKKKKFKLLCKRVSAQRCKGYQKHRRKTTNLTVCNDKCGSRAVSAPQVGKSNTLVKSLLHNAFFHEDSCSHGIRDDEAQWDITTTSEVVNGNGEDTHAETSSTFPFNVGERTEISDKEGCGLGISATSGLDYGQSQDEAFNAVREKEGPTSDERNNTSSISENESGRTSIIGLKNSVQSRGPDQERQCVLLQNAL